MIYKITVNFPLSLDMKPGSSNPNKWYRIIIIIILIIIIAKVLQSIRI